MKKKIYEETEENDERRNRLETTKMKGYGRGERGTKQEKRERERGRGTESDREEDRKKEREGRELQEVRIGDGKEGREEVSPRSSPYV